MKKVKQLIAVLLFVMIAFSCIACSASNDSKKSAGDVTKSPQNSSEGAKDSDSSENTEPVTITTIMNSENLKNCPEGMTEESNPFQELWKSKGINVEYTAVAANAADMDTKLNLAIAGEELPDVFSCNAQQYAELMEAGLLMDITDVYEQYASDELKARIDADGGLMAQNVMVDGRRYGITTSAAYNDFVAVVAIRTDWLKKLGLEEPKNMEDVWKIAEAFQKNKMDGTCTIGIGATQNVLDALTPIEELLNGYGAYTATWLEKDGKLEYSVIQPEMRNALEKLGAKFKAGILDPEFGSKDTVKLMEDAISGKSGVVVSHFCAPFDLVNGVKLGQEWGYFPMLTEDGKQAKAQQSASFNGAVVISKDCKNPEAVIELYNLYAKFKAEQGDIYDKDGVNNFSYPFIMEIPNENNLAQKQYVEFLETGKDPEQTASGYASNKEAAEKWRLNSDVEGYIYWAIFGPESTESIVSMALENDGYQVSKFTGAPGENVSKYSANLKTLTEQMVTYIINGTEPIEYFDTFVEKWKSNGGDAMTQEVNEWYANIK